MIMEQLKNNYIFHGKDVVVREDDRPLDGVELERFSSLFPDADYYTEKANSIAAVGLKNKANLPDGYAWATIRSKFAEATDDAAAYPMARAKALLEWRRDAHFCGRCGSPLQESAQFTAMECPKCGNLIFPRINPCVIVLVSKGDKILLARHAQRNQDVYTCLAGFVEAGETIENAVHREIMEETGIRVKNVKYFGSQSWPFPAQLMFGFTADYESGEITPQPDEIAEAAWFDRNNHPATPQKGSLAYSLIHS